MERNGDLLSKRDVSFLLELIHSCLSCTDEDQLNQLMVRANGIVPYEFALCGYGTVNRKANESYKLINVSYPQQWAEAYVTSNLDQCDPIVKENFSTFRLQYWADTFAKYSDSGPFVRRAADFGLKGGYSYGLRNYSGDKTSLFSFAARSMDRDPRTELILEYLVPHLHQAFARIVDNNRERQTEPGAQLSSREKEILKWARNGKSTWEISVILSISKDTVKFHVKNIMQKLQTVSRTQAVAVAIESGLIGID